MARSICLLIVLVGFLAQSSALLRANIAEGSWKKNPVSKVIDLMKEMKATLEKEAEEDEKIYDAMVCWCETGEKAKTKSVADGTHHDKMLTELIPELAARMAQLKVEIEQLKKETAENEKALSEATEIREKELAEFRTEEKNAVVTLTGLKNAIQTIGKNHGGAFNQEVLLQVRQLISEHAKGHPEAGRLAASLLQRGSSKAPASGEIFGILKGMKESFEGNLASSKTEESEAAAEYKELKSAKEQELSAATQQIENKQVELADSGEKRVKSKEDLVDTRAQVKADTAFLMDLQQRCGTMDKQFADRTKMRQDEMKAVGEALSILTDDDAQDLMRRSTFIQKSATSSKSLRQQVTKLLRSASKRFASSQLAMLATATQDDVFAKIKEMVNQVIVQLKKEQADEVKQRDLCIEDLNTNEKELVDKNSQKKDLETMIEEFNLSIERLNQEIDAAKAEIVDTRKEMKLAEENREKENKVFQDTVMDQRATQQILAKALKKLKAFYDAKAAAAASMLQVQAATHRQAPPPAFAPYKKAGGAGGVVGMMEMIIDESKGEEAEAVADESKAQKDYESFIKDSTEAVAALEKSITDKTEAMEKAKGDFLRAESDLTSTNGDIADLESVGVSLHSSCDFLLKNFEVRQSSRTQEMEALSEAKALMSGAPAY